MLQFYIPEVKEVIQVHYVQMGEAQSVIIIVLFTSVVQSKRNGWWPQSPLLLEFTRTIVSRFRDHIHVNLRITVVGTVELVELVVGSLFFENLGTSI